MADSILPLHAVPKPQIVDYLSRRGMTNEVIEWKYFDDRFNRGRERGYVWKRDDQVEGFIGLIPWGVRRGDDRLDVVWGCDWSVADPNTSKGMGLALATHSMSLHRPWLSLGGSAKARLIMPHLCHHKVDDAGLVFWQPLRLGAALKKLGEHNRLAAWLEQTFLRSIPVRWVARPSSRRPDVITEPGLAPAASELIEHEHHTDWHPHHRFDDLAWSLDRCPSISTRTCYIQGLSGVEAAAVLWRNSQAADFWKVTLWAAPMRHALLADLLHEVRWQVFQEGGVAISTLVSHLQTDMIEQLQANGYWQQPRPLPMYLVGKHKQSLPFLDMTGLSYLCTDLAYRF